MKTFPGINRNVATALLLLSGVVAVCAQKHDRWEDSLTIIIRSTRSSGLPVEPLENKIREGRAKGRTAEEIHAVVRERQAQLQQIKERHHGTVPGGYMRELFDHEKKNSLLNEKSPVPTARRQTPEKKKTNRTVAKEPATIPPAYDHATDTQGRSNGKKGAGMEKRENLAEDRAVKQMEKAEKSMEKSAVKAERRMEKMQKRVQKRAVKRHGFEK